MRSLAVIFLFVTTCVQDPPEDFPGAEWECTCDVSNGTTWPVEPFCDQGLTISVQEKAEFECTALNAPETCGPCVCWVLDVLWCVNA